MQGTPNRNPVTHHIGIFGREYAVNLASRSEVENLANRQKRLGRNTQVADEGSDAVRGLYILSFELVLATTHNFFGDDGEPCPRDRDRPLNRLVVGWPESRNLS